MTIRLTQTSYGDPAFAQGIEIDDAGSALSWQTAGNRVRRFARELAAKERTRLDRALTAARGAAAAEPSTGRAKPPAGTTERLSVPGLPVVDVSGSETPAVGFGDLFTLLRSLREDLADSPVAAIELIVDGAPLGARLRHIGTKSITVRASEITVQATAFARNSALVDSAAHMVEAMGLDGPVEEGWELRLTDDLGLAAVPRGGILTVTAGTIEVDSLGDGVLQPTDFSWMSE